MRCAVIDLDTNIVIGIIMADATVDRAPDNTFLINLPEGSPVGIDWVYDLATQQFIAPMGFNWIYDPITQQYTAPADV